MDSVNEYKNAVYDVLYLSQNVLYFEAELSYIPIFFSSKVRGHPDNNHSVEFDNYFGVLHLLRDNFYVCDNFFHEKFCMH